MKILLFFVSALFLIIPQTHAQSVVLSDNPGESIITGTVKEVRFDIVILKVEGASDVTVDIDNLNIDEGLFDEYYPVGTMVKIVGDFDDDEFKADHVVEISEEEENQVIINTDG